MDRPTLKQAAFLRRAVKKNKGSAKTALKSGLEKVLVPQDPAFEKIRKALLATKRPGPGHTPPPNTALLQERLTLGK